MARKNQHPEDSPQTCACCTDLPDHSLDRTPADSKGRYKAMVLACIDPRMQKPVYKYLNKKKLTGKYSQVTIAGAAIGVVAPRFEAWHQTFWDNLNISIALHQIPRVIVINHRQCGAATEAFGPFEYDSKDETRLHKGVLADFRRQLTKHHPLLRVETLLMGLDGNVKNLS